MKSLLSCSLVFMTLLFTNCKKTEYVQPNRTIYASLDPSNWHYDASTNTYYNQVAVPEINDQVAQQDGVLVYLTLDNTIYEALPDVVDGVSFIYNYQNGGLTVEAQNSDGTIGSAPTGNYSLKIVLVDSSN